MATRLPDAYQYHVGAVVGILIFILISVNTFTITHIFHYILNFYHE